MDAVSPDALESAALELENVGLDDLDCFTARGVAEKLNLSERQAWRLIHGGEIESFRIGRSVRVARRDLQAYIKKRRAAAGIAAASGPAA